MIIMINKARPTQLEILSISCSDSTQISLTHRSYYVLNNATESHLYQPKEKDKLKCFLSGNIRKLCEEPHTAFSASIQSEIQSRNINEGLCSE